MTVTRSELEAMRQLLNDLHDLLGLPEAVPASEASVLDGRDGVESLEDLLRDLLVSLVGLEVRGL